MPVGLSSYLICPSIHLPCPWGSLRIICLLCLLALICALSMWFLCLLCPCGSDICPVHVACWALMSAMSVATVTKLHGMISQGPQIEAKCFLMGGVWKNLSHTSYIKSNSGRERKLKIKARSFSQQFFSSSWLNLSFLLSPACLKFSAVPGLDSKF